LEHKTGRLLDSLDIHAYPSDGLGSNIGNDDASNAQRLRLTRSWWDPTYVDESWFGVDGQYVSNQTLPGTAMYIPRFRKLVADNYPGTKFGIGEWDLGADTYFSSGLAVADTLGIFGREKLDWSTYWTNPADQSFTAAAFWLYRGNSTYPFPSFANQITFQTTPDPDFVGIYGGTTKAQGGGKPALVVVNKHLTQSIFLKMGSNVDFDGLFAARHFGGAGGAGFGAVDIKIDDGLVVVAAQSALLIHKV